jgi:multicomponent Na+:H+ antiporter subunit C
MTSALLFKVVAVLLVALGTFGVIALRHLLRKILALNLLSAGVFLFLVSAAVRDNGFADPVPHAMVITGIVVSVSSTALALALVSRIHSARGQAQLRWWRTREQNDGGAA